MAIDSWDIMVLERVTLGVTITPQSAGFSITPNIIILHNSREGYSLPVRELVRMNDTLTGFGPLASMKLERSGLQLG